jgi:tetratricopeptide (TPR) repeat protein
MEIAPLERFYPSIEELNPEQLRSYIFIRDKIDSGNYVDIDGNISYVFLYIYELLGSIMSKGIDQCDNIISRLAWIETTYTSVFPTLPIYTQGWIGDTHIMKGDYDEALKYYETLLSPDKVNAGLGSHILNVKLHIGKPASAVDLMSINKMITKFGKSNINLIVNYVELQLQHETEIKGVDYLKYLGTKYRDTSYDGFSLYSGVPSGYTLGQFYMRQPHSIKKTIWFVNIHELLEFMKDTTRAAENAVREDMNIPRVGEGWVSETDLYYKLKSHFSDYQVVQHYIPSWLGRQHLDIFFPDHNIAVEYQGAQHSQAVKLFGGDEALLKNQRRDVLKKKKCKQNKVHLIYVEENYNLEDIISSIESQIQQKLQ